MGLVGGKECEMTRWNLRGTRSADDVDVWRGGAMRTVDLEGFTIVVDEIWDLAIS